MKTLLINSGTNTTVGGGGGGTNPVGLMQKVDETPRMSLPPHPPTPPKKGQLKHPEM